MAEASSRPFKAKRYGTCPIGPEGVHHISEGDIVVRLERPLRWHKEMISQRTLRRYLGACQADYVHADCLEKYNAKKG